MKNHPRRTPARRPLTDAERVERLRRRYLRELVTIATEIRRPNGLRALASWARLLRAFDDAFTPGGAQKGGAR